MKYRPEIDGLRALAVIPVILFHAGFESFGGGFIGVDVFFVISGYLITTIIIDDVENKRFSLNSFYERRARRILPALIVVLLFTYAISWFVYLPGSHKVVGQYVVSSIFSASNILLYLKGSDYFGLESSSNPLFHTWSLGVEEQFYLIVPILILLLWGRTSRWQLFLVAIILVGSLGVTVWKLNDYSFNFYMVVSRAWELGFGMLAAVILRNKITQPSAILSSTGILLIVCSVFMMPADHHLLSLLLFIPVIGSFLFIVFASHDDFASKLLSHKTILIIGLMSYSLYLWHIPIFTFISYMWGNSDIHLLSYFFILTIFSFISYKFVERPFRQQSLSLKSFILMVGGASIGLASFGVIGHLNNGYPARTEVFMNLEHNNGFGLMCNGNTDITPKCSSGPAPKVAVLGNSYSMVYVNSLVNDFKQNLVQLTQDSCALGYVDKVDDVNSKSCEKFYRSAVETIVENEDIQTVIISSPFTREISNSDYKNSFLELLYDIKGKNLVVIGPTPKAPFSIGECMVKGNLLGTAKGCSFPLGTNDERDIDTLKETVESSSTAQFIDITKLICPNDYCTMEVGEEDAMYIDRGHLSKTGARKVLDQIFSSLRL